MDVESNTGRRELTGSTKSAMREAYEFQEAIELKKILLQFELSLAGRGVELMPKTREELYKGLQLIVSSDGTKEPTTPT